MRGERLGNPERPGINSDLYQHTHRPQPIGSDPSDGLPRPVSPVTMEQSRAPALSLDSFVCAEDASAYVLRRCYGGDVVVTVNPGQVTVRPDGTTVVHKNNLSPEDWEKALRYAKEDALFGSERMTYFYVEPLRPQCAHYKRVLTDLEGDGKAKSCERSCSAQRTESGEFASLRDTRVYACEFRSPPDFVSLQRLKDFDRKAMEASVRENQELDLEAALAAVNNREDNGE